MRVHYDVLWGRTESDTTEVTQQQQQHDVLSTFVYVQNIYSEKVKNVYDKHFVYNVFYL